MCVAFDGRGWLVWADITFVPINALKAGSAVSSHISCYACVMWLTLGALLFVMFSLCIFSAPRVLYKEPHSAYIFPPYSPQPGTSSALSYIWGRRFSFLSAMRDAAPRASHVCCGAFISAWCISAGRCLCHGRSANWKAHAQSERHHTFLSSHVNYAAGNFYLLPVAYVATYDIDVGYRACSVLYRH